MKTAAQWVEILAGCGVKPSTAASWAIYFSSEVLEANFSKGAQEIPHFVANIVHESGGLEQLEENLNYSAGALLSKFGRHRISEADCWAYGRTPSQKANQPMIANCLYGGPWGLKNLGNTQLGDGWKYRGSGAIQATGLVNFQYLEKVTGLPLVANPDLLRRPGPEALAVAIAWWEGKVSDTVIGNVRATRKAVNGGDFGLAHVEDLTEELQGRLA